MRDETELNRAIELYADTIRRICFLHLKNYADAEDVFQDVFMKYILFERPFDSTEHERAWLIRVTVNACRDVLKSFFRRKVVSVSELYSEPVYMPENERELLDCVLRLPDKYKNVIYLFYYEGYSASEMAKILGKNENTIYTWLNRARKELRERLGGAPFE